MIFASDIFIIGLHARCDPEGSAQCREDCEYNLKNLFPSFFLHNFLVFLVVNKSE